MQDTPTLRIAETPKDMITPDQARGMTGLDLLRAIVDGRFAGPPICRTMDFRLVDAAEGRAVFEGAVGFQHLNPMGGVHGGWFGTLLDSCMGCAVHSRLPAGRGYTTLEYKINLVRAPTPENGLLRAIGEATHVGRRTGVAEGWIVDAEGRLYATGSTTCLVFDF